MKAGKLRHKIIVQQYTDGTNDNGYPEKTWTDFVTLWANIQPLRGKEYFAAKTEHSEVSHTIIYRYYPGVTSDMRIKYGNRYFDIESVINADERNYELQIMGVEKVGSDE
jgi:SPP1 family predicted phage head-tail adaptor